jgi:hypothetical protein
MPDMIDAYVSRKVREALSAAGGSRAGAQRLLMQWAMADTDLLRGLCRPFLKAMAGSAVERATRGQAPVAAAPAPRRAQPLPPEALDALIDRMGSRLGMQPPILNGAPVRAEGTPKQARAVRTLAAAFVHKKFDRG